MTHSHVDTLATADPPGMVMYVKIGTNSKGLTLWQSTRGSSKNEAANLVLERSMHTTGKMKQVTATGWLSGLWGQGALGTLPGKHMCCMRTGMAVLCLSFSAGL